MRGTLRGCAEELRKGCCAFQRVAVRPAAAVSGGIRSRGAVHPVVRREERTRHRLARMGHRRLHHLPVLLHEADGEVLQGGKAVQLRAESGSVVEAHQAADEVAGSAGRPPHPAVCRRDARQSVLHLRRRADFLRSFADSASRRHHRRDWPCRLRQIHLRARISLRNALWRLGSLRRQGTFELLAAGNLRYGRLFGT